MKIGLTSILLAFLASHCLAQGNEIVWHKAAGPYYIVSSLSISENDKYAASGSTDGKVRIYNLLTGEPYQTINELETNFYEKGIWSTHFVGDTEIFCGYGSGLIEKWDIKNKLKLHALPKLDGDAMCITHSSDKKYLSASSNKGMIKIWKYDTFEEYKTLLSLSGYSVNTIVFSSNSQYLAFIDHQTIRVYDLEQDKVVRTHDLKAPVIDIAFTHNSNDILALTGTTTNIHQCNLETGIITQRKFPFYARAIRVNKEENRIYLSTTAGIFRFNYADSSYVRSANGISHYPFDISNAGDFVIGVNATYSYTGYAFPSGEIQTTYIGHSNTIQRVIFTPDQKNLVTSSSDRHVKIWDLTTTNLEADLFIDGGSLAALDATNNAVISGNEDGKLATYDRVSHDFNIIWGAHSKSITDVKFATLDDKIFVSVGNDSLMKLWRIGDPTPIKVFDPFDGKVIRVQFALNDSLLVCAGGRTCWVVEAQTGTVLKEIIIGQLVKDFQFSDRDSTIYLLSSYGIEVFSPKKEVVAKKSYPIPSNNIRTFSLTSDENVLVCCYVDGVIRSLYLDSRLIKDSITVSNMILRTFAIAPDEKYIATGSFTGDVIYWNNRIATGSVTKAQKNSSTFITLVTPNPARDEIRVNFTASGNEPVFIDVLNALGQLVGRYEGSNQSAVFSVKAYMSGLYTITVRQGSQIASAQFLVH